MTLTYELDLDILPFDLHAKSQVHMSVRLTMRVVTDRQTHNIKTITPDTSQNLGCKNGYLKLVDLARSVRTSRI